MARTVVAAIMGLSMPFSAQSSKMKAIIMGASKKKILRPTFFAFAPGRDSRQFKNPMR